MTSSKQPPQIKSRDFLRQADFKLSLILFCVCLALFVYTLVHFPMSGSYGGVENQWYVSPALFPLVVLFILLVCSIILGVRAFLDGGHADLTNISTWFGDVNDTRSWDRAYVIVTLILYVYMFIPSLDFYLATVLFLLSLTLRFYFQCHAVRVLGLSLQCVLMLALLVLRIAVLGEYFFFSSVALTDSQMILYSDISAVVAIGGYGVFLTINFREHSTKIFQLLMTSFLVPIILIIVFTYLLYVPMPVEYGSVMTLLNILVYDILGIN